MIWIPRPFAAFLAGLCGAQVLIAQVAEPAKPVWLVWIFSLVAIWAILSWRKDWLESKARWERVKREREE